VTDVVVRGRVERQDPRMGMEATAVVERIGEITIPSRFNGPRTSANGGYACGAVARFVGEPAEVTLRTPPALDRPLIVVAGEEDGVSLFDGETLVAEARPAELPLLEPPLRPTFEQALEARSKHPALGVRHPLSDCFVCGPERSDGLHVSPGPIDVDADIGAAPFEPDQSVADVGFVRHEVVWGALDCPSYVPSMWNGGRMETGKISLLGRFTAERHREISVGERLAVVGWPLGSEGRKRHTATALIDGDGEIAARAMATWIELR
jgi:hypothetical protein